MSRRTAPYVSGCNVGLPGNMKKPVTPYASTGITGTPSGSAASAARRSAMMLSVSSERYACCSVEPTGSTIRSSRPRYSSSCIQLRSRTRTAANLSALERCQELPQPLRQVRSVVGVRLRRVVLAPDLEHVRKEPRRDCKLQCAEELSFVCERPPGGDICGTGRLRILERPRRLQPRPEREADARVPPVVDRDAPVALEHIPFVQVVVLDRRRQT